MSSLTQLPNST